MNDNTVRDGAEQALHQIRVILLQISTIVYHCHYNVNV